ncbi:MAG: hypothetical protein AAF797_10180 [Planctomycetota bacterium]
MPRISSRVCSLALLASAAALLTVSTGCSSKITSSDIRANPSPELYTTAHTLEEYRNDKAQTLDWYVRSLRDDIDSVLLLDRPSRLTIYPAP